MEKMYRSKYQRVVRKVAGCDGVSAHEKKPGKTLFHLPYLIFTIKYSEYLWLDVITDVQ